uniref:Uncharacterized protein n=1 Tax=Siphoviridae sp. ctBLh2 TaxID=2827803 RepID=A0A8S5S3J1_9CAUD|nr:MAG TPA: hypothetical protein [Siphoviridae sp. ctBLh2]
MATKSLFVHTIKFHTFATVRKSFPYAKNNSTHYSRAMFQRAVFCNPVKGGGRPSPSVA